MPISHCQHHLRQELSVDAEPTIARTLGSLKYMYNIICKRPEEDERHKSLRNAIDCNAVPGIEEGEHIKLGFHCNPS